MKSYGVIIQMKPLQHFTKIKLAIIFEISLSAVKGLRQQYPSDAATLTVTHKFFAAPKPPGKTRAS